MTIMAKKFTPEVMLSAPRRSAGQPNPTGTHALFTVTSYSFEDHKKTSQIRVLDVKTGNSELLYENGAYSEPTWITDREFLFFKNGGDKGGTFLMLGDASKPGSEPTEVRHFRGNLSNLRIKPLSNGGFGFACSAPTTSQGKMATPETEKKSHSTGKIYDKLFVRHWDAWCSEAENSIWYGRLQRDDSSSAMTFASSDGLTNALAGTKLISPVPPFGGTGDFDIGPEGLVFVAKDPELKPLASYTKSDLYFIPLSTFEEEPAPKAKVVKTPGLEGYSAGPIFAHDGKRVAFTRMRSRQYESDKTRLMVVDVTSDDLTAEEFYKTEDGEGRWDAKPEGILWSSDDKTVFVTAEEHGRSKVWKLPSNPAEAKELPVALTDEGSVSAIALLAEAGDSDQLFLSSSSIVDNSYYTLLDPSASNSTLISSATLSGKKFGLSHSQLSSFWTPSSDRTYNIHSWVLKPSNFSPDKKYPLCFWIHGGPQGAWMDGWSTRWNPAIFAEAGYVVVSPNPTGSSGYGMALQDGITGEWGGRPYEDLVKAFEYVQENLHYVDTENAVAMGASYGGYMINWIQGHPLGRKFKALVCHDGVFSTLHQWTTEELFFPIHDFEGTLWENREGYEKWDPARHLDQWATPQLIIHSELDYRLPVTEGLAAFNVLQHKGVPSRLLVFPDENHWVLKPENSLMWHKEVLRWINHYTGLQKDANPEETKVALR